MYQPPRTARERAIIRVKQPRLVGKISKLIRSASARSTYLSNSVKTYQSFFKSTAARADLLGFEKLVPMPSSLDWLSWIHKHPLKRQSKGRYYKRQKPSFRKRKRYYK